jgi:uncharacterized protein DUF1569
MDFYLQRTLNAIESATANMDLAQLAAHPEGKWSSAEILEHLLLTFSGTAKKLQRVFESGKPAGGRPTLRHRLAHLVLLDIGYFPSGRQAPEYARPRGIPPEAVLPQIREELTRMDAVVTDCERRFGSQTRIADHPILGPFTVQQWRKFHWVHTRHHMKQIAALRALD